MSIELPLHGQEKPNSCALACLRMVLAAFGTEVTEAAIEAHAQMQERGILIDELEQLARHFNLIAKIQDTTVDDLRVFLADGKLPITYLDRAVFDLSPAQRTKHSLRKAIIHTVVPSKVTEKFVTFNDPLPPAITRRTFRLFSDAYMRLGGRCVVCAKPRR